jgi:hypothetical protein
MSPEQTPDELGTRQNAAAETLVQREGREVPIRDAAEIAGLSDENKGFLEKISDGGKKIFDTLLKIPRINKKVAGKAIWCEEYFMKECNKKTEKFGGEARLLDTKIGIRERAIADLTTRIEELRVEGDTVRAASLELKLQVKTVEKANFENKRNSLSDKIREQEARARVFAGKRDGIANKMIGYYNEKMAPMEAEVVSLQTDKNDLIAFVAEREAQFNEWTSRINDLENGKKRNIEELTRDGASKEEIKEEAKEFDEEIKELRDQLKEKDNLKQQQLEIEQKIAEAMGKMSGHKENRGEFENKKIIRPLNITQADAANSGRGETNGPGDRRQENNDVFGRDVADPNPSGPASADRRGDLRQEAHFLDPDGVNSFREINELPREDTPEDNDQHTARVNKYILKWNEYVQGGFLNGFSPEAISSLSISNADDFLETTGLSNSESLTFREFKNKIYGYYKEHYRGIETNVSYINDVGPFKTTMNRFYGRIEGTDIFS